MACQPHQPQETINQPSQCANETAAAITCPSCGARIQLCDNKPVQRPAEKLYDFIMDTLRTREIECTRNEQITFNLPSGYEWEHFCEMKARFYEKQPNWMLEAEVPGLSLAADGLRVSTCSSTWTVTIKPHSVLIKYLNGVYNDAVRQDRARRGF